MGDRFPSNSNFMRDHVQAAVAIRREGKTRLNVVGREVREIVQHFGNGHAAAQIIEHVGYRDAGSADAGFAAANARIDADALSVVHAAT